MAAWDRFDAYCKSEDLRSLPTHFSTVASYLGWIHLRGTFPASSLASYLAPIDTVHKLTGFPPPTSDPIFKRLRRCYMRLKATSRGAMRPFAASLPPDMLLAAVRLGSGKPTPEQRRMSAGMVLAYLMFNWPGAVATTRAADMVFTSQGLRVQRLFHKSDART